MLALATDIAAGDRPALTRFLNAPLVTIIAVAFFVFCFRLREPTECVLRDSPRVFTNRFANLTFQAAFFSDLHLRVR